MNVGELLDRVAGLDVLVVGGSALDRWWDGRAARLCREGPVPVVDVERAVERPGAAANVAANVAALGARTTVVTAVGADAEGARLLSLCREARVETSEAVVVPGRPTVVKTRLSAGDQIVARFDLGDDDHPHPSGTVAARLAGALARRWEAADAVIVSDNALGFVDDELIGLVAALQQSRPRTLAVDSRRRLARLARLRPTVAKPNRSEVADLLGWPPAAVSPAAVETAGDDLLERTGALVVAATLDREGSVVLERGRPPTGLAARAVPESNTGGAGDSYLAAFTCALAAGATPSTAGRLAARAAAAVVRAPYTATCDPGVLRDAPPTGRKLVSAGEELAAVADAHRSAGHRIVFTNGCFDLLHAGHITYLDQARRLGDVLIVGLNSDDSVRRLKGPGRPVSPLPDRARMLASLECVDHVVPFDGDRPLEEIRTVGPDVYVKGGDYTPGMLDEAPLVERLGGEVVIVGYVADHSSSGLIERIRDRADPAPVEAGHRPG